MNTNISVRNNQAFSKEYLNIAYMLGGSIPATFIPEHVSGYTPLRVKMINFILRSLNINKISFPSQSTIAKAVGCNREAVNRAFKFFEDQGLFIVKSGKKRYRTNIYSLGSVLCNEHVRWALRYVCTGLTRAYYRIADDLRKMVKNAIVEPKRTLLYKINVLKNNTSISSYREKRLYSTPFLKKDAWLNIQKHLWSDWSLREIDLHIQREERESMYQQWKKPKQEVKAEPTISKDFGKIDPNTMNERLVMCNSETNLNRRLAMLEKLKTQVQRASVPYINLVIKKTRRKIATC